LAQGIQKKDIRIKFGSRSPGKQGTSVAILAQGIQNNCIRSNFGAKHPEKGHICEQLGSRLERLGAERQNHSAQRGAREGGEGESVVLSSIL